VSVRVGLWLIQSFKKLFCHGLTQTHTDNWHVQRRQRRWSGRSAPL